MSTYNGWTNYETWRINLEVVDGMTIADFGFDLHDVDTDEVAETERLAEGIESYADEVVLGETPEGLARDLAADFLNRVDWVEIAEHMIADARAEA